MSETFIIDLPPCNCSQYLKLRDENKRLREALHENGRLRGALHEVVLNSIGSSCAVCRDSARRAKAVLGEKP